MGVPCCGRRPWMCTTHMRAPGSSCCMGLLQPHAQRASSSATHAHASAGYSTQLAHLPTTCSHLLTQHKHNCVWCIRMQVRHAVCLHPALGCPADAAVHACKDQAGEKPDTNPAVLLCLHQCALCFPCSQALLACRTACCFNLSASFTAASACKALRVLSGRWQCK